MRLRPSLIAALLMLSIGRSTVVFANLYWDSNGNVAGGSGADTAPGTWGSDNFWSGDPNGEAATGAWTADETAVFAAAANVVGTYDVTISGTQSASGITFEEGAVTLTGGTVNLTNTATVTLNPGLTATINSVIDGTAGLKVVGSGVSTLVLNGANTYTGATAIANSASANMLRLGANEVIRDTSIVQILGANAILDVNGKTETVKSIANVGGGPFTNSRIDIGSGNLIINDDLGESETFAITLNSATNGKLTKSGQGTLVLSASNTGWFGEVVLSGGTLSLGANNTIGRTQDAAARLTLNGGTLTQNSATASKSIQTLNVDITNSFTALMTGGNMELIGGTVSAEGTAVITLKTANPTITVNNTAGTAGTFIFRGVVGEDVAGRGFTKSGPGTLTIANPANTWTGDTVVAEGQLRVDANGRIGDGTHTVFLSGGNLATSQPRDVTTDPIANPINVTQNAAIVTVFGGATTPPTFTTDLNLTGALSGTAGTLTFRNDAINNGTNNVTQFEPRLSADFTFSRPIEIAAGLINTTRTTRLNSANAGMQTLSGIISGPGKYRRMAGGTTVLSGANTFSGGTEVEGGTLSISGQTATAGGGNVTVTGGMLSIAGGVLNAIADTATLSISGTGIVSLGEGINDLIAGLTLGGEIKGNGTYGSSFSSATFKLDQYFAGSGMVKIGGPAGDFDGDGHVDGDDLTDPTLGFQARFGHDLDGANFLEWQRNFGTPAVPITAAVPEPASLALASLAVVGPLVLVRRRTRAAK